MKKDMYEIYKKIRKETPPPPSIMKAGKGKGSYTRKVKHKKGE